MSARPLVVLVKLSFACFNSIKMKPGDEEGHIKLSPADWGSRVLLSFPSLGA
ncbi:hypothetical protein HanIR_Chr01g0000011 [Helianthus annuus]|nr:hypothetical protein HanIR_Chr01g0000011 [Helianthus annuus]